MTRAAAETLDTTGRLAGPPLTENGLLAGDGLLTGDEPLVEDDLLVEEISIDGMCGVY